MNIPMDKAVLALNMLLEGCSIRATERLTGINRNTLCSLVVTVGQNCKRFLERAIHKLPAKEVECDETWGFVGCKSKLAFKNNYGDELGDVYCHVAIDRNTKLVLAWHLGKRGTEDTDYFIEKLDKATTGRMQVTTDGHRPYPTSIQFILGSRVDYGRLIKNYGRTREGAEQRYSPAVIISATKKLGYGEPNPDRICTSHCERFNLSLRMSVRRLTRLTNAHSKKLENHEAMLALFMAWYNFCRPHSSLKNRTPAEGHGLTDRKWTIEELLKMAVEFNTATQL